MALKLFSSVPNDAIQMILLGEMNWLKNKERNGVALLIEIEYLKGVSTNWLREAKFKGKLQDPVNDYFPQNQWIFSEENLKEMPTSMYVHGINGVYNISMMYQDDLKSIARISFTWANEGFN